jgi:dTMP kinase
MQHGKFLVLEGIDGSGKTSLRKALFRLIARITGCTPLALPTTNYLDPAVATTLVRGKYAPQVIYLDAYLNALNRDNRLSFEQLIAPALSSRWVIADRWLFSEVVFMDLKYGLNPRESYERLSTGLTRGADLTLLLDADPTVTVERTAQRRGDSTRKDWDILPVQQRAREVFAGFVDEAQHYPLMGKLARLDASASRADLLLRAWHEVEALIENEALSHEWQ